MEFDLSKLDRTEWVGMGAALVLAFSTLLPWFVTDGDNPNSTIKGVHGGPDGGSFNVWQSFDIVQYLIVATCIAPFILAWIIVRGHDVGWNQGEITAIVGALALTIVLLNGIILGQPGSVEVYLSWGYPISAVAAATILVTGAMRATKLQKKQPPGV